MSPAASTSPIEFFDSESKDKIVKQCVDNLISPEKLATVYKCVPKTIRTWVKKSGHSLPRNYTNNLRDLETYNSSLPASNIEVVLQFTSINSQSFPFILNRLNSLTIFYIHPQSFTFMNNHLHSCKIIYIHAQSFTFILDHFQSLRSFTFIHNHYHVQCTITYR